MKRIFQIAFSALLAVILVCASSACQKTPSIDTPKEDVPEFTGFSVSDLSSIDIIYPEYCTNEIYHAGKALCDAIEAKTSIRPGYRSSYVDGTEPEYSEAEWEILIGVCENREECADAARSVRWMDYGYKLVDKKIVFYGANDESIISAIKAFTDNVVNTCDNETFYSYTMNYMYVAEYEISSAVLNGMAIYEYGIVYPNKGTLYESKNAERLATAITEKTGYVLAVTSDKSVDVASGNWISIGSTKLVDSAVSGSDMADGAYTLSVDERGNILLGCGSVSGCVGGTNALISMLTEGDNTVEVNIDDVIEGSHNMANMTIMSFNILTTKPDEARINRVVQTILNADADTVGLQEVSPYWMDVLKERLKHTYAYVGEGRDGGHNGEYSCIFYKKDAFELLDSNTFWLSETPDTPSVHPDSAYPRIMTYAKLRNKSTGQVFVHVNTHLDHVGVEARKFQSTVLTEKASAFEGLPILMTGDFNCVSSEETYKNIINAGYSNAALIAPVAEKQATFPGNGKVIDFCFCNEFVYPLEYEVVDEMIDGEYPSDHYPIVIHYGM